METDLSNDILTPELIACAARNKSGIARFKSTRKIYLVWAVVKAGTYGSITCSRDYHYARCIRNNKGYGRTLSTTPENIEWLINPPVA
jgi:hypothetical protein